MVQIPAHRDLIEILWGDEAVVNYRAKIGIHPPNLFVGYRLNLRYGYPDCPADIAHEQRSALGYVADRKNANTIRRGLDPRIKVTMWQVLA